MPRPCSTDHALSPLNCRLCWLNEGRADYRALWDSLPSLATAKAACRRLGPPTGGTVECPSCRGRVELKLFACAAHGRCTIGKPAPGVACCVGCPEYEAAAAPED